MGGGGVIELRGLTQKTRGSVAVRTVECNGKSHSGRIRG